MIERPIIKKDNIKVTYTTATYTLLHWNGTN